MASASSNEFHLIVPEAQKTEAKLGSDVTAPCHLSPKVSAVDMEIRWFKETDCVCLYKNRAVIEGRNYEGRAGLSTEELERGNVSLNLRKFRESDMGVYLCQVISEDRTEEMTVAIEEAREDSDGQQRNQPSKIQGGRVHLTLHQSNKTWGENQRLKMEESALMAELQVNYVKVLHQTIFKVFKNQGKKLERTELQLKASEVDLERVFQKLHTITEKCGLLQDEKHLNMKESQIQQIEKQLLQITKYMEEKQIQLQEKDIQLEKMSEHMSEKEKLMENTIKEMETSKQQLEKEEQLRTSELNEKSKSLEETKSLLEERDAKIHDLEKEKDRLEEELQDKDKRLKDMNAKMMQTVREVEKKQNQLQGKHMQLENMHKMLSEKMKRPENQTKELEANKCQPEK